MCRFALYLGDEISISSLLTEPTHSLIHQSFQSKEREEPLNGDGFGVGWYVPQLQTSPAIFKAITPAWNNINLLNLAPVTRSGCILAHVRAATPGLPIIQLNCHPFGAGPFCFMHNGYIAGFRGIRRKLLRRLSDDAFGAIQGSTDSEYLFGLFLDHYGPIEEEGAEAASDRTEKMVKALEATIAEIEAMRKEEGIEEASQLNLAVTDGRSAVISRYASHTPERTNTLYLHAGSHYVCEDGVCWMPESTEELPGAVLVASEPLYTSADWHRVSPGKLVVIHPDRNIDLRKITSV